MAVWFLVRPLLRDSREKIFPHAAAAMARTARAKRHCTGSHWPFERLAGVAFNVYYLMVFAITAAIVARFQARKKPNESAPPS
jgi:hypothetical protein